VPTYKTKYYSNSGGVVVGVGRGNRIGWERVLEMTEEAETACIVSHRKLGVYLLEGGKVVLSALPLRLNRAPLGLDG